MRKSLDIWKLEEYSNEDLYSRLVEVREEIVTLKRVNKETKIPFDHYMMELNSLIIEEDFIVYEKSRRIDNKS